MGKQRFLVSTRTAGLEFRVLEAKPAEDGDGFMCTLVGSHGITFERRINDATLEKNGYRIEVRTVGD